MEFSEKASDARNIIEERVPTDATVQNLKEKHKASQGTALPDCPAWVMLHVTCPWFLPGFLLCRVS